MFYLIIWVQNQTRSKVGPGGGEESDNLGGEIGQKLDFGGVFPETSLENLSEVFLIAEANTESGLLDTPDEAAFQQPAGLLETYFAEVFIGGEAGNSFQAAVQLPFAEEDFGRYQLNG